MLLRVASQPVYFSFTSNDHSPAGVFFLHAVSELAKLSFELGVTNFDTYVACLITGVTTDIKNVLYGWGGAVT